VTAAGGTLAGPSTASIVSVTTNGSGVVTTINSVVSIGYYSVAPATSNSATGGTGTGLILTLPTYVGWLDAASQTVDATFAANRTALNASIIAAVANGQLDGYIDPNPYVESQTSPGKFQDAATLDGTHFVQAFAISASAAATAAVPQFSTKRVVNYLLERDLKPGSNDNSPAFLRRSA